MSHPLKHNNIYYILAGRRTIFLSDKRCREGKKLTLDSFDFLKTLPKKKKKGHDHFQMNKLFLLSLNVESIGQVR